MIRELLRERENAAIERENAAISVDGKNSHLTDKRDEAHTSYRARKDKRDAWAAAEKPW